MQKIKKKKKTNERSWRCTCIWGMIIYEKKSWISEEKGGGQWLLKEEYAKDRSWKKQMRDKERSGKCHLPAVSFVSKGIKWQLTMLPSVSFGILFVVKGQ